MEVATVGILKEIRRVSDPDKAQIIWDGIKVLDNSDGFIRHRKIRLLPFNHASHTIIQLGTILANVGHFWSGI